MNITTHFLKDDGTFPNNEFLPLIIYLGVFDQDNMMPTVLRKDLVNIPGVIAGTMASFLTIITIVLHMKYWLFIKVQ